MYFFYLDTRNNNIAVVKKESTHSHTCSVFYYHTKHEKHFKTSIEDVKTLLVRNKFIFISNLQKLESFEKNHPEYLL
jgi:hypothetical protein